MPQPQSWANLSSGDQAPGSSQSQLPSPQVTPEQVLGAEVNQTGALLAFPQPWVAESKERSACFRKWSLARGWLLCEALWPRRGARTPNTGSCRGCGCPHLLPHQASGREAVPSTEGNLSNITALSFTKLCHVLQSKTTRSKPFLPPSSPASPRNVPNTLQTCLCSLSVGQMYRPKTKA